MNFELARHNMVEQQVRTWEVLEPRVLDVLKTVPREDFVSPRYRKLAYADTALPLDDAEHMMKPVVEGRLLQALNPQPGDRVLEIGTGSGYLTACLAALAGQVDSVERQAPLVESARRKLDGYGVENVTLAHADALDGYEPGQSYDAIAVTGSMADVPELFVSWLASGGRMFVVTGAEPVMEAQLVRLLESGTRTSESLFETRLKRLVGAEDKAKFEF
ncbi:MAG: protein-L-isoaspartate O-methyltransferase [Pseudomonadota bacterium]